MVHRDKSLLPVTRGRLWVGWQDSRTLYNYFRDYDPATGRYVESDPIGLAAGVNTYVGNRPLSYTDPTGYATKYTGTSVGVGYNFALGAEGGWAVLISNPYLLAAGIFYDIIFGGDSPPPPPPMALPGISAQTGVNLCGPGSSSFACGSGAPFPGATGGFNPMGFGSGAPVADPAAAPILAAAGPVTSLLEQMIAAMIGSGGGATARQGHRERATSASKSPEAKQIFVTYVLVNPTTGQVYVGRTSGIGFEDIVSAEQIARRRYSGHHMRPGFVFDHVDRYASGESGRIAIRGREQQLLDWYGGNESPNTGNTDRAVDKRDKLGGPLFHEASDFLFGPLFPYTGCLPLPGCVTLP